MLHPFQLWPVPELSRLSGRRRCNNVLYLRGAPEEEEATMAEAD